MFDYALIAIEAGIQAVEKGQLAEHHLGADRQLEVTHARTLTFDLQS